MEKGIIFIMSQAGETGKLQNAIGIVLVHVTVKFLAPIFGIQLHCLVWLISPQITMHFLKLHPVSLQARKRRSSPNMI